LLALLSVLAMAASAVALDRAVRGNARGRSPANGLLVALAGALTATIALGFVTAGIAPPTSHAYAATTAVLLGYCALHTALTVVFSGYALLRWRRGYISPVRSLDLRVIRLWGLYTAVVTIIALALVHGLPALLGEVA
jgi:cytochrome c oxidase subunit I+III